MKSELDSVCHAGRDGDCNWEKCPQLLDGEPNKTGRHCPLDQEGTAELRAEVFRSMDSAEENGYDQIYENPQAVAEDIAEYDATFEGMSPGVLLPHIVAWQEVKRLSGAPRQDLDLEGRLRKN